MLNWKPWRRKRGLRFPNGIPRVPSSQTTPESSTVSFSTVDLTPSKEPVVRYWDEHYNWVLPPDVFDITPWLGVLGIMQLFLVFNIADAETEEDYYSTAVAVGGVSPTKGDTHAAPILAGRITPEQAGLDLGYRCAESRWFTDGGAGDPDRPSGLA